MVAAMLQNYILQEKNVADMAEIVIAMTMGDLTILYVAIQI